MYDFGIGSVSGGNDAAWTGKLAGKFDQVYGEKGGNCIFEGYFDDKKETVTKRAGSTDVAPVPARDSNPPTVDNNQPSKAPALEKGLDLSNGIQPLEIYLQVSHPEHAGRTVENDDGTSYTYDKNGYVVDIHDENGLHTATIWRDHDGSVTYYLEREYNEAGNMTRQIMRNANGSVKEYTDIEYDKAGNRTRLIVRNADGSVDSYQDYEYDEAGNMTRQIVLNADGSVDGSFDYEYDEAGNMTRQEYNRQ